MNWFSKLMGRSEFAQKAARIVEIRRGGGGEVATTMSIGGVEISQDDYFLMGCDNSCAARNYPEVPEDSRHEGRWFKGGHDLDGSRFGNCHATQRKDGSWAVDSFYTTLPPTKYQAEPREVAWHYLRVKEMRAAGIPQPERIATLKREAADRPWERMS